MRAPLPPAAAVARRVLRYRDNPGVLVTMPPRRRSAPPPKGASTQRTPPPSDDSQQMLIDAGRSEFGWSRIGNFFKCPLLYGIGQVAGIQLIPGDGLTRGSMGHTAAAHWFARWGCRQGGVVVDDTVFGRDDADRFYSPEDAVEVWVERNGRGQEFLGRVIDSFRAYTAKHPEPPGRILAVECPLVGVVGWRDGVWGYWLTDAPDSLIPDGLPEVEPTLLDCEGHKDHNKPIVLTRRIDLIWQSYSGAVYGWDHKFMSSVSPASAQQEYRNDGGFRAQAMLCAHTFPREGGRTALAGSHTGFRYIAANLIGTRSPYPSQPVEIRRSAWRENRFGSNLYDREQHRAQLELETLRGDRALDEWPAAEHSGVCNDRWYGCEAMRNGICLEGELRI